MMKINQQIHNIHIFFLSQIILHQYFYNIFVEAVIFVKLHFKTKKNLTRNQRCYRKYLIRISDVEKIPR